MKNKEPIKIKFNVLLIIIAILLCLLGIIIFIIVSNREQNVEGCYIDNMRYNQLVGMPNTKQNSSSVGCVIDNYSDYINIFSNYNDVLQILQNFVNEDFFNNSSLVLLNDSTNSVDGLDGHICKISIKKDTANFTIKRYSQSRRTCCTTSKALYYTYI